MIFRTRTALLCIASVALALLSAALYAQENDAQIEVPAPHQTPVSGDTSADPDPAMHAVVNPESVSAAEAELLPQAKSVDLGEPVATQEATTAVAAPVVPPVSAAETPQAAKAEVETLPLVLLGTNVPPMTSARLSWSPAQSMEGLASPTPVLVVHGKTEGPTLCLTAAIHGDELNGIEIVRRVLYNIKPQSLRGSVIGVPIVNLQGFQRNSRYLPDRRDLNRYFPGYPKGSAAARMAYSFFHEIIKQCDVLVDLHTGSFDRTNLPQLRADLSKPEVAELTKGFGATVVLHGDGAVGSLRRAAVEFGIPAVTIEAGGPVRLQEDAIEHSVKSIHTLMYRMNMVKKSRSWGVPEPVYYSSQWVRANTGRHPAQ